MGIDVYVKYDGQPQAEADQQMCGFNIYMGHVGYLREAYHGQPYATKLLAPECWQSENQEADIPAATLRARLPLVQSAARVRSITIYKDDPPDERAVQAFEDFVAYCERAESKTGKPCTIIASY